MLIWSNAIQRATAFLDLLYMQNVLRMFDIEGKFLKDFPLDVGTVTGYSGRKKDTEVQCVAAASALHAPEAIAGPGVLEPENVSNQTIVHKGRT